MHDIFRGLAFIDNIKEIIKLFEKSTREEIGISLLAYEEFICKGNKITGKDLKKLEKVFKWYDEYCSDDCPSLTNRVLQDCDTLICNANEFEKDGYKFTFDYCRNNSSTSFVVEVREKKTGIIEDELHYEVKDSSINSSYGKDSFNTMYNACEKIKSHIQEKDLNEILRSYKI